MLDINKMIHENDAKNENSTKTTELIFESCKDEVYENLCKRTIEANFEYGITIYDSELLSHIIKHFNFNNVSSSDIDTTGMFVHEGSLYRSLYLSAYGLADENEKENIKTIIDSVDYKLLKQKICRYMEAKGFDARVATNRFTNERGKLLEFKITRNKLLASVNKKVDIPSSTGDSFENTPMFMCIFYGLLVFAFFAFLIIKSF